MNVCQSGSSSVNRAAGGTGSGGKGGGQGVSVFVDGKSVRR